jgi:carbamoyltransferase
VASDRFLCAARPERGRLAEEVASRIAAGQILAWFQGRSEYGPRALGHRSVLADPRDPEAPGRIGRRFKVREWYRPFAPSVLASHVGDFFEPGPASPFMLTTLVARPHAHTLIPAVVHTDGSARVQSMPEDGSPYHRVLSAFARETGVPILLNTSFNLSGEPIVETPEDAIDTFLRSELDALVLGPWIIEKKKTS